jgi:hypothetical protein
LTSFADQRAEVARFRVLHPEAWLVPRFWELGTP